MGVAERRRPLEAVSSKKKPACSCSSRVSFHLPVFLFIHSDPKFLLHLFVYIRFKRRRSQLKFTILDLVERFLGLRITDRFIIFFVHPDKGPLSQVYKRTFKYRSNRYHIVRFQTSAYLQLPILLDSGSLRADSFEPAAAIDEDIKFGPHSQPYSTRRFQENIQTIHHHIQSTTTNYLAVDTGKKFRYPLSNSPSTAQIRHLAIFAISAGNSITAVTIWTRQDVR